MIKEGVISTGQEKTMIQFCDVADSLELRRLRHNLIYTYKIVFGLINGADNDLFWLFTLTVSQVSFISLVREVIRTNYFLTVTVLTCTSISSHIAAHNRHMEQPTCQTEWLQYIVLPGLFILSEFLFIYRHIQIAMTVVPRLQNSSYRYQRKVKK